MTATFTVNDDSIQIRNPKLTKNAKQHLDLYLHGVVQAKADYDIPLLIDGDFEVKEQYKIPCFVELRDMERLNCFLFVWKCRNFLADKTMSCFKGLIVETTDTRAIDYAQSRFENKVVFL